MNARALWYPRACAHAAVALAVATASARPQSVDRSGPPQVPPPRAFKFPNVRAPDVLSNGVRVYVIEDHSVPVVSVRVVTAADSTFDPPGKEGLYAVTLGALSQGTVTRSDEQLASDAADIGTRITPTGFTTTTTLFPRALALLADMLTQPRLDSASVQRRKALRSAAARRLAQSTVTAPRHLFYAMLYGVDDPYVRSLAPSEATIGSITTADVADFYRSWFRPEYTSLIIAGDVDRDDAVRQIRRSFDAWRSAATPPPAHEMAVVPTRPTTIYLYDVPGTQAYVYVGAAGPARTSAEACAADAMGATALVRFQRALRDRRSFMYSGATGFTWRRASRPSAFVGSTVVAAAKVDSVLLEWLAMLRGLRGAEPIMPAELAAAQRIRVGALAARIDGADSLSARLAEIVRDTLPLDYWDRYAAQVSALRVADLAAAAVRVLDMDHLVIVVAGDRTLIEPSLRAAKIGPVVLVDASGRPLPPEK